MRKKRFDWDAFMAGFAILLMAVMFAAIVVQDHMIRTGGGL